MAPQTPTEATALVALMLLHDSRRDARVDEAGDLVVLEEQDRRRWNQQQIAEALPLVGEVRRGPGVPGARFPARWGGGPGPFALQAAIAAEHCKAARPDDTDWAEIVRLYDLLEGVSMRRVPICCAESDPQWKRRRATIVRSRWLPMRANVDFSTGDCAKFSLG